MNNRGVFLRKRVALLTMLVLFRLASANAESLDFTANIIEAGTCDFKMLNTPSKLTFKVPVNRFSGIGTIAKIFPITFQMSNCKNTSGTKTASIEVHGTESQIGNNLLFHTTGTAKGMGIALRVGKYSYGDFNKPGQFIHSGTEAYKSLSLGDKTLSFTAALISSLPQEQLTPGSFSSVISFDIKYN